jgi:hypothetical protein
VSLEKTELLIFHRLTNHDIDGWTKSVVNTTPAPTSQRTLFGKNYPALNIANANLNDEVVYICTATNSVGTGRSQQSYLDVVGGNFVISYSRLLHERYL